MGHILCMMMILSPLLMVVVMVVVVTTAVTCEWLVSDPADCEIEDQPRPPLSGNTILNVFPSILAPTNSLGTLSKKKRGFLGIFPKGGGGVFSNPKTFVNLPSVFLYAKIILRCQNMFYNSGEVISDQFHHITLNSKSEKF